MDDLLATNISLGNTSVHDTKLSPYESIGMSLLSLASITINTACAIACFRNMKSDFYRFSVLLLIMNDAFSGLSWLLYGISASFLSSYQLVGLCLFATFSFAFGSLTQYSILLFICLQRYFTIKSYNFGTNKIFNKYRYLLLIGTLCFTFLFALSVTMFTPFEQTIFVCSSTELFGQSFIIFFVLIFVPLAFLLVSVISTTVITGIRIWKIFFSSRVQPVNVEMSSGNESSINRNEIESSNQISPNQSIRRLSSIHIQFQDSCVENDTVQNLTEEQSKNNDDVNYKHRRQVDSISDDEPPERRPRISLVRIEKKAWEIRAFSTCVIIVMSAVIFSGPFFASYWLEILTGTVVPRQTHAYLFLVHMLNLVVDPFIYAWRIPEIKGQMKRIIKC